MHVYTPTELARAVERAEWWAKWGLEPDGLTPIRREEGRRAVVFTGRVGDALVLPMPEQLDATRLGAAVRWLG